jgi:hypothetical protein
MRGSIPPLLEQFFMTWRVIKQWIRLHDVTPATILSLPSIKKCRVFFEKFEVTQLVMYFSDVTESNGLSFVKINLVI